MKNIILLGCMLFISNVMFAQNKLELLPKKTGPIIKITNVTFEGILSSPCDTVGSYQLLPTMQCSGCDPIYSSWSWDKNKKSCLDATNKDIKLVISNCKIGEKFKSISYYKSGNSYLIIEIRK